MFTLPPQGPKVLSYWLPGILAATAQTLFLHACRWAIAQPQISSSKIESGNNLLAIEFIESKAYL